MAAVPVIMDRIRQGVMEKVKEGPRLLQLFFTFAYSYKLKQLRICLHFKSRDTTCEIKRRKGEFSDAFSDIFSAAHRDKRY